MKFDVVVLGAGIVGVCVALHLQKKGRSVLLVDRRKPGAETSFGNAGLIQREAIYPYGFPQDFGLLVRYSANRAIDMHYHAFALPTIAPFLWQYWKNSGPARHDAIARIYAKLIERCVDEHDVLITEAGAEHLVRRNGWIKVFRSEAVRDTNFADAERLKQEFGVTYRALDRRDLEREEPFLAPGLAGGLHWTQPISTSSPHGLVTAYAALFQKLGGRYVQADARTLEANGAQWTVRSVEGPMQADAAVLALGPWADVITRSLGYDLPLAVKRGYHMHYRPAGDAKLNHPILDYERGYLLAPMERGIRLTTGAEFALRDAMRTPVQLGRAEPIARDLVPLAERLDTEAWMGARPCTPDMMPIIGPAPKHRNLWFAFGHAHHGLTLGPVTGRLVAEMITGEATVVDPTPYRADRFSS
ncbi:FAD-binding oxidoreductase [Bradyrhizobium sp. LHD-71]|uniref:NAD(P)/FAD-dependent oxidoreductase n=1 Tax=Bradyrhizobium sp. LHD-71 TaxID=3072141 RepID=UPI00280D4075|nr:FAD-binding oxidoreductase [Bradyrhizobium sp. LHD-71]MDQ8731981.1 FAD-binding oxidoreductase [Bradyrhizobium sp. LHD-71]